MTTSENTGAPPVPFDTRDESLRFGDSAVYEQVWAAGGIARTEHGDGAWLVADYELCRRIAADHERFRSGQGVRIPHAWEPMVLALEYDRPQHTAHRRILTDAVGPRAVRALEPMVRNHARALLGAAGPLDRIDLSRDYAFPLPLDVIFSVVGAPPQEKAELVALVEALFLFGTPLPDGGDPVARLQQLLDRVIAAKRAAADGDWLSQIAAHATDRAGGPDLSESEVRGAVVALLAGGSHSTARAIACLLARIATDDELQHLLRTHPERIPDAAEESLRLSTPLRWFARRVAQDVELGGVRMSRGDVVYLLYAGSNLDPRHFPDAQRFGLDRPRSRDHLAWGWGIHRCVGMPLAQLELRVAVEELFAVSSRVTPTDRIDWATSVEPRRIPCTLTPPTP